MPRHRRSDNREGVTRIAAKACRIRQHRNDPAKIRERARPTVREQQRDWIGALALDVNIVKIDRVDLHRVLSELIQRGFVLAPVVLVAPIVDERPEILQIDPVVPSWRNLIRPAHVLQSLLQIHKRRVRHCDPEWFEKIWLGSGRHWSHHDGSWFKPQRLAHLLPGSAYSDISRLPAVRPSTRNAQPRISSRLSDPA